MAARNEFGRRYLTVQEFSSYAKTLGLNVPYPESLLEFAERHEILVPAARVRFPGEIVRRWWQDRYPAERLPQPIECDGAHLAAATAFKRLLLPGPLGPSDFFGRKDHPLDEVALEYEAFVSKTFTRASFVQWEQFRIPIAEGGSEVYTYYHAWQVFPLAAFLRSGASLLYDVRNEMVLHTIFAPDFASAGRENLYININIEARHELHAILANARCFDVVAFFNDRCNRALQEHAYSVNRATGRLSSDAQRAYSRRQREVAQLAISRFCMDSGALLDFISFQSGLWATARDLSTVAIAAEYKRNIESTMSLLRLTDRSRAAFAGVRDHVGFIGGYRQPIFDVIFPDWIKDQRDIVEGLLRNWVIPDLASMPAPHAVGHTDIPAFCDWIESHGFYQFYWHFRRLSDLGMHDDGVSRAATAMEVVGLVTLIEHLANQILQERVPPITSAQAPTLASKLYEILGKTSRITSDLIKFKKLRDTSKKTLRWQLSVINRIRRGGARANVVRTLLKLVVIRNTASHLGLAKFSREEIYGLLKSLLAAALITWKAR